MSLDLVGVNAKLDRATTHWEDLHTDGCAGPLYPSVDLRREDGPTVRWVAEYVQPVSATFAPTLGDCLHNYRSALDHIVAEVRRAEGLGDNHKSQFPILKDHAQWDRALARDLDGLPERVVEVIRQHQPFERTEPDLDVLGRLNALDNTDKHRRLNIVVVQGKTLGTVNLPSGSGGLVWHPDPIEPGVTVAEHPRQAGEVNVDITAEVALAEMDGRWRVGELIWYVDRRVRQVVNDVVDAYGGVPTPYFTGPLGPSGYPDGCTNRFDPTGRVTYGR